jgi:transcriptional regulator with XRE-family HTH domain
MTQVETARLIGLHQAAFSRVEAGTQDMTAVELLLLCDAFEIGISELVP